MRLLHAGDDPRSACAALVKSAATREDIVDAISATSAAAPAMRRSSRRSRLPPSACAGRTSRLIRIDRAREKIPLRFVRSPRTRGPPLCRRQGQLRRRHRAAGRQACGVGDLSASRGAHPVDRQVRGADHARRALRPGWRGARRRDQCARRRPRYAERAALSARPRIARYAGEWVAAVVADSRALAEDAAEAVVVEYEPLPFVLDADEAYAGGTLCTRRMAPTCCSTDLRLGVRSRRISPRAAHAQAPRQMGRSSTCRSKPSGDGELGPVARNLDVWASIQMPKYPDQTAMALKIPMSSVRVHYDVDVGGSYASSAASSTRCWSAICRNGSACRCG